MSGAKEIRTKIKSIQSTQKITSAMEMVAASKMRKAQDRMAASRPYAEKMLQVIRHLAFAHPEYRPPVLEHDREVKSGVGYIVISTDRGLCGGLNINLFRAVLKELGEWKKKGIPAVYGCVGSKALAYFKRLEGRLLAQVTNVGEYPHLEDIIGVTKVMRDAFVEGEIDRIYVATNQFVNTMTQQPLILQVAPVPQEDMGEEISHHWDYIYEPDSVDMVNTLLERYVESIIYQAVVENIACEQSARRVAMKAATDNAKELIDELQLMYNKARQASITQELNEIVGGAAAV
jgi:F-type H+-transporting ATPase subunit gamma